MDKRPAQRERERGERGVADLNTSSKVGRILSLQLSLFHSGIHAFLQVRSLVIIGQLAFSGRENKLLDQIKRAVPTLLR